MGIEETVIHGCVRVVEDRPAREAENSHHWGRGAEEPPIVWHLLLKKGGCGRDITLQEGESAGCDDELVLPWHLDPGPLLSCTKPRVVHAIVIVVVPYEIAIYKACNRDCTKLHETKEEEQMKTSFLRGTQASHW